MKKRRLKKYVIPFALTMVLIIGLYVTSSLLNKDLKEVSNPTFVNNAVIESNQPVMNTKIRMIYPYTDASVKIGKSYYDYQADEESQKNSIIYHDETYIQNSGIDYISDNQFDVISVLDGTVSNIKQDELLGNVVEVKHDNNYISTYQSLSKVNVKKGDQVTQGQVLGTSGENELDKEIGNHLHFELNINGQNVNPEVHLNKEVTSIKEKE